MDILASGRRRIVDRVAAFVPGVRALGGVGGVRRTAHAAQEAHEQAGGTIELAKLLVGSLPATARALSGLARDSRVRRRHRFALLALVPYLLSPIDPIPDFIPVVGAMDDALLVAFVLRWVVRSVPHDVLAEHWQGSPILLDLIERTAGVGTPVGSSADAAERKP